MKKRYIWWMLIFIPCLLLFDSFQRNSEVCEVSEKLSSEYLLNYQKSRYRLLFDLETTLDAPNSNDALRTMLDDNYERKIVIKSPERDAILIVYKKDGVGTLNGTLNISSSFSPDHTQLIIRSLPNNLMIQAIFLSYFLFLLYLYMKKRNRFK